MRAKSITGPAMVSVIGATLAACGAAGPPGREGDLGHGTFEYQCLTDQDPACPSTQNTLAGCSGSTLTTSPSTLCFPSAVAVGSRFRVGFTPNSSTTNVGNPTLKPVAPDYLFALGDGQFKAIKPGYVGVFAQSTVDSKLVDYIMVKVDPITRLQIIDTVTRKGVPPTPITISKGTTVAYELNALDPNGQALAGAVEGFLWETSDANFVALQNDPHTATMHVTGVGPGRATLTAYADDTKAVKATLQISVQ
jgi:hypothetical protein